MSEAPVSFYQRPKVRQEFNPSELDDPVLLHFLDIWRSRRKGRVMPARSDIRISDAGRYAAHMTIVDVIDGGDDFRFKLIGSAVADYSFESQTGKTVREAYAGRFETFGQGVLENYRMVVRDSLPLFASVEGVPWIRDLVMNFAAIHLPLSNDGLKADCVLSAMVSEYAPRV
jgi:hypothetical protein